MTPKNTSFYANKIEKIIYKLTDVGYQINRQLMQLKLEL